METRSKALEKIERHMAQALASKEETAALDHIMALQHTFECNGADPTLMLPGHRNTDILTIVPLRLLSWISLATARLETLARASMDGEFRVASIVKVSHTSRQKLRSRKHRRSPLNSLSLSISSKVLL